MKEVEPDTVLDSIVTTLREVVEEFDGKIVNADDMQGTFHAHEDDTLRMHNVEPFTTFTLDFRGEPAQKIVIVVYDVTDLP